MVGSTVTLDPEHEAPPLLRVQYAQIDAKSRYADLRHDLVAAAADRARDRFLERTVEIGRIDLAGGDLSGLGEMQEFAQHARSTRLGVGRNIAGRDRREHDALPPRARDQHIEAPLPAVLRYRPETGRHPPLRVGTVADRDEDDVAFVALDCFEVLDEQAFAFRSEGFCRGQHAARLQGIVDRIPLRDRKAGDTDGFARALRQMLLDLLGDQIGLDRVAPEPPRS